MRHWLTLVVLFSLFLLSGCADVTYATSAQAYQDYLHQFDLYRQRSADFQVAKNEYEKFQSLASETAALDKTKLMLTQRDLLLRAYLFLLNEKLNEDRGLGATEKQLYQTLIRNEVTFLENHAQLIPSIGSIDDAVDVSRELESHCKVLQASMRQIIGGISVGQLNYLSQLFDKTFLAGQGVSGSSASLFTSEKQSTINRWVLQITNKRSLFQQKLNSIIQANAQLKAMDQRELDRRFSDIVQDVAEAKQYLLEGTSFLGELATALKYLD